MNEKILEKFFFGKWKFNQGESKLRKGFINEVVRVAVCKYREFAVKTEILKFVIFSQEKPFGETVSKITVRVSKEFSFSRKPAKSEMLPHTI